MTTFQSAVVAFVHAFSSILPIGNSAHAWILDRLVGWGPVSVGYMAVFDFSVACAILIVFRHDWASILSSLIRLLLSFRRPRALDEQLGLAILVTLAPPIAAWVYFRNEFQSWPNSLLTIGASLIVLSFPMTLAERSSRNKKGILNWGFFDAVLVGLTQLTVFLPGGGRQEGALTGAFLRNFSREAVCKFMLLSFVPLLILRGSAELSQARIIGSLPWVDSKLSLGVGVLVTFGSTVLAIGGWTRTVETKGLRPFVIYRLILAASAAIWAFGFGSGLQS